MGDAEDAGKRMTFSAVRALAVPQESKCSDEAADDIADKILNLSVLSLDWQNFRNIDNLDALTNLTELHLQHNRIRRIENLDFHSKLTFLALGNNRIEKVENLHHLVNLQFLDLSENSIRSKDAPPDEFPPRLVILDLEGNPCAASKHHADALAAALSELAVLNKVRIRGSGPTPYDERVEDILEVERDSPDEHRTADEVQEEFERLSIEHSEKVRQRFDQRKQDIIERAKERRQGLEEELQREEEYEEKKSCAA